MSLDFRLFYEEDGNKISVFDKNITHNLTEMASEAYIYKALWRPEESGYEKASDIVSILKEGLAKMKAKPEYYKNFDAPNGWGTYEVFVPWVEEVFEACKKYPNSKISIWR